MNSLSMDSNLRSYFLRWFSVTIQENLRVQLVRERERDVPSKIVQRNLHNSFFSRLHVCPIVIIDHIVHMLSE